MFWAAELLGQRWDSERKVQECEGALDHPLTGLGA